MTESDQVGKGHPPKKNQYGRGQRRAPGRPKGARSAKSIVREIAGEIHHVQLNGRKRSVTTFELLLISARELAMGGNLKAAKWLDEYRARAHLNPEEKAGGFLVVPEVMSPEMFVKTMEFENRFATNPELRDDPLLARRSDS
jgi:hypothetical protein